MAARHILLLLSFPCCFLPLFCPAQKLGRGRSGSDPPPRGGSLTDSPQEIRKTVIFGISHVGTGSPNIITIGAPMTIDPESHDRYWAECMMVKHTYEIFVNWLNLERGGVTVAGKNYMLNLVLVDDQSSLGGATSAMKYIVERLGVKIVMGPLNNERNIAAAPIVHQSGGVMVAAFAGHPDVYKGHPNIFGLMTAAGSWKNEAVYAVAKQGAKTIVIIHEDSRLSYKLLQGLGLAAKQKNITMLATIKGPHSWIDGFEEAAAQCKELDPDVVMTILYGAGGEINFVKALRRAGYQPKMLVVGDIPADSLQRYSPEFPGDTGRFLMGSTLWSPYAPFNSSWAAGWSAKTFGAKYKKLYDKTPLWEAASGWAALEVLVQSIEAANSLEPRLIADQLRALDAETIFGRVKFLNGTNTAKMSFLQYHANSIVPIFVAPPEAAQGSLIYPMPRWEDRKCILVTPENSAYGYGSSDQCQVCPEVAIFNEAKQRRLCVSCPTGKIAVPYDGIGNISYYGNIPLRICQKSCPVGQALGVDGKCESCDPGSFELGAKCYTCLDGTVTTEAGMTLCTACILGKFAATLGMSLCENCPAGTFANDPGSKECRNCSAGYFAAERGSSECQTCVVGTFADKPSSSACESCGGPDQATFHMISGEFALHVGARSRDMCGCRKGTQPVGNTKCEPCGEGLLCPGKGEVLVESGYASDGRLSTYRCHVSPQRCPGGLKGTCAPGRDVESIGCSLCKDGKTPGENGMCVECEAGSYALVAIICLAFFMTLLAIYFVNLNGIVQSHGSSLTLAGIVAGQALGMSQSLGILASLNIDWREPLALTLSAFTFFTFDTDILRPNCFLGVDVVLRFLSRIFIIIFSLLVLTIVHAIIVMAWYRNDFRGRSHVLIASTGTVVYSLFLSVVSSVFSAFHCHAHPNGQSTLWAYPSQLCWEGGRQGTMAILAIISSMFPLSFIAVAAWVTYVFPRKARKADVFYFRCWGFLMFRYKPQAFWYAFLVLCRNVFVAIAPLFYNEVVQVYICLIAMLGNFSVALVIFPWVYQGANVFDIVNLFTLLMFLITGLAFVENTNPLALSNITLTLICIVVITAVAMAIYSAVHACTDRKRKPFQFFLCHYKIEAGSFCRLLKTTLIQTPGVGRKIFLDCDDLFDLPQLFGYVASQTSNFVVVHSLGILYRPWCLGEIVTAHKNNIKSVRVMFADVASPTEEFVNQCSTLVPGIDKLYEYGIMPPIIRAALFWFTSLEWIQVPHMLGSVVIDDISAALVKFHKTSQVSMIQALVIPRLPPALTMIIIVNVEDLEAMSTALILRIGLIDLIHADTCIGHSMSTDSVPEVLYSTEHIPRATTRAILICTANVFLQEFIMKTLCECAQLQMVVTPILGDDRFRIPDTKLISEVQEAASRFQLDCEPILAVITQIFCAIAIVFNACHSSEAILKVKAKVIFERIAKPPEADQTLSESLKLSESFQSSATTTRSARPIEEVSSTCSRGLTLRSATTRSFKDIVHECSRSGSQLDVLGVSSNAACGPVANSFIAAGDRAGHVAIAREHDAFAIHCIQNIAPHLADDSGLKWI